MTEKRNVYRILVGKSEGKRPLGRSRRMWVDNIKMNLREIRWDGMDWVDGFLRTRYSTFGFHKKLEVLRGCTIGGFSRRAQLSE
jgi:hypothetical protein